MKQGLVLCLLGFASLLSAADICYEKSTDKAVQFAVKDMARCLTRVSGQTYKVRETIASPQKGDIVIVNDPQLEKQQWQFAFRDGKLYLSGRGAPGIVYGIYTFLEKYAGCAWFAPDVEVIPKNPAWKLPGVNEKGKPAIARREFYVATPAPDWIWRLRNKENYRAAYDLNMRIGSPKDCHTFDVYVKAIKDPKLFGPSISGGESHTLCMTNPEVRKIVLAELLKYIEKDRAKFKNSPAYVRPVIYDLSQSDGPSGMECWCPNCKALAEKEGSYAGPNLDFVNDLAREVRKKYPDVILQTFAYSYTQKPPKNMRAEENVMIRFCDAKLNHPLIPGTDNAKEMEAWGKIAAKKAVWSYWRIHQGFLYPIVKTRKDISGEIRFCVKNGVASYFGENEDMMGRSFAVQQHYLGLKMMDDPTQDIEKLNDRFMAAYYGKAAPFMKQYLDYLEKHQEETRAFLNKEFFEKVNVWLDSAEKAVQNDARSLLHVQCERVIVDRTMFFTLSNLIKQGYKADFKAVCLRFRDNGAKQIKLWASIRSDLRPKLEEKHRNEVDLFSHFPAEIPEQFKGCEIIDIHWNQLQRLPQTVKDPDAVCGVAVRDPKCVQTLPFRMGFYSPTRRTGSRLEFMKEDIPQDEKFHLYKIGNARILAPLYIYFDKTWRVQIYLSSIGILGENRDIWVSIKFQGEPWVTGSKKPGMVLFDRILLVKDTDPLRGYEPVDLSKNLLKNGGFEKYNKNWIEQWGRNQPKACIDTTEKHSGKASLRVGDVEKSYVVAEVNLGKVRNLKNDLLIRGWFKQKNIKSKGLAFIGLWSFDARSGNIAYRVSVAEIVPGSSDWQYFEKTVRINDFKDRVLKAKPLPGERVSFQIHFWRQPGTVWVDDLEIIPLEKK